MLDNDAMLKDTALIHNATNSTLDIPPSFQRQGGNGTKEGKENRMVEQ